MAAGPRWSTGTPTCPGAAWSTGWTAGPRNWPAFGIGAGAWFGAMLGNVPEMVILAAAASKLGAVLVPLDPTLASRELDMILEAAPLRALITRPHGGDTPTPAPASPSRGDGRKAGPPPRTREPPPAAGDAAERSPLPPQSPRCSTRRGPGHRAVHRRRRRRSQGGHPLRGAAGGHRRDRGRGPEHRRRGAGAGGGAAAQQLRLRRRTAGAAVLGGDPLPGGRGVGEAADQAAARRTHRRVPRQPVRAGGAVARGGGETPHRQERPVSQLGVNPAGRRGRRVSRAVPGARAVLLPQHRDRTDQPGSRRQGSGHRGQALSRRRAAHGQRRHAGARR